MITILMTTLVLGAPVDCSFRGGFQKASEDFKANSIGANPDRFCYGNSADERKAFLEAYEHGQTYAPLFQEVGILNIPSDKIEFEALVKEARLLKIQIESSKKEPSIQVESLQKKINALDEENRQLREKMTISNSSQN